MFRKMKGVNKFRIDPEHLRRMLERQSDLQMIYSEFMGTDNQRGVQEVPGFLTMDLAGMGNSIKKRPIPPGSYNAVT
jgi:hypothetical protein